MAINFTTSILPLYATNVVTDAPYLAVSPARRDVAFEQGLLTQIEVTRAFMETLRDEDQARMFLYAMGRLSAGIPIGRIYDDLTVSALGNAAQAHGAAANGNTFTATTASGTATVTLAGGPFASVDALVAAINAGLAATPEVRAVNNAGRVEFRNPTAHVGVQFTLGHHVSGARLLDKIGIEAKTYVNPVAARANNARDDALAHFQRAVNPVAP